MAGHWLLDVVYVTGLVAVCVQALGSIRKMVVKAARFRVKDVIEAWRSVLQQFTQRPREERDEGDIRVLVQTRMEAEMVKSMRSLIAYVAPAYMLITTSILVNIYQKSARWMTPGQDVTVVCLTCMHTLLYFFPSLIRPRTVRAVYLSQMVATMLFNSFSSNRRVDGFATITVVYMMRMTYSVAFFDQVSVPFANILGLAVSCLHRTVNPDSNLRMILIYETVACCCTIAVSRSMSEHRASTVRQELKETTLKGQSSALTTLLNLVCDVVFELDRDLRFTEDLPKLSALLTLGGRVKSLKGSKLQDFMPVEEDRQRFEQRLLEPAESSSLGDDQADFLPGALPVKIRDSLGNTLNMEIFYAQCHCLGQVRFFLGLREDLMTEPVSDLQSFPKRRKRRGSRRAAGSRQHAQAAQAEAEDEAPAAPNEAGSSSGASDSDQDSAGSDAGADDCDTLSPGSLLDARWQEITGKGKVLVTIKALEKCNIRIGRTVCCTWHAAISDMRATLDKFEGVSCAGAFSVKGDWQCSQCGAMEGGRQSDPDAGVAQCSTCSYGEHLLRGHTALVCL